ncbi:transporter substrate-binding domain-containing protein [Pigmentibacter sp. JX0631]|uniref:substrate-binding periplasmic protein n=1 Tax=Pigmentibacter sp. JX0631 TaxID=2976982 RepID=UPI0024696724|nr:transporter substrate-binding domain-containing protein [Pigmentibacter sp. JX0631]WGL59270.1 transporter substrate-binding domain-containing protein [Pigmentibacter sp. JX0631]
MKNIAQNILIFFIILMQLKVIALEKKLKIIVEETPIRSYLEDVLNEKKTAKKDPNEKPSDAKEEKGGENTPQKKLVGSDIEITTKLFARLNIPIEFEIVHWTQVLPKIISGEADLALGIEKKSKFDKYVIFPRLPTYTKNYSFYALAKQVQENPIMTFEDALAHNYSVGILVGFSYPKIFWDAYPFENKQLNNHLKEGRSLRNNLIGLKEKKFDLILADRERADVLLKKIGAEETITHFKNILFWKEFYLVFSKKMVNDKFPELKSKVERELYKMTESEQMKDINESWVFKGIN